MILALKKNQQFIDSEALVNNRLVWTKLTVLRKLRCTCCNQWEDIYLYMYHVEEGWICDCAKFIHLDSNLYFEKISQFFLFFKNYFIYTEQISNFNNFPTCM